MSNRERNRRVYLARVRLVAYDYLSPTQQHRSLAMPDPSPTPLATSGFYPSYVPYVPYVPYVLHSLRARKQPLRRVVLLYD